MKEKMLSQTGFATIQMVIAGALLIAGITYVMSSRINLKKMEVTVHSKQKFETAKRELVEVLSQGKVCLSTIGRIGRLTEDNPFDGIYNYEGEIIYGVGSTLLGKTVTSMKLEGYQPVTDGSVSTQDVQFAVVLENVGVGVSYGAQSLTQRVNMKLTTLNNEVISCRSNETAALLVSFKTACENLGGKFDEGSHRCREIHGAKSGLLKFVNEKFCGKDKSCQHPYAGKKCTGNDVRGKSWGNFVITGFGSGNSITCACVPIKCQDPSTVCANKDIGTDHCSLECGRGTKTDGVCSSGCQENLWQPAVDLSEVCKTRQVIQKNGCNVLRTLIGEKSC